jgi:type IV conjugative transfer system lipoprotein TraV
MRIKIKNIKEVKKIGKNNPVFFPGLTLVKSCFLTSLIRLASLTALVSLTGCSTALNDKFDCPMKPGVVCKSLGQVNKAVDRGQIGRNDKQAVKISKVSREMKNFMINSSAAYQIDGSKTYDPLRHEERVIKVWIAPYEDDVGNYHQGNTTATVAKKGYWIEHLPKVVLED